jgi:hypothetical protein
MCTCGHNNNPMTALQDQSPVQKLLTAIHVNKMEREKHYKTAKETEHCIFLHVPVWQLQECIRQTCKSSGWSKSREDITNMLSPLIMYQIEDRLLQLLRGGGGGVLPLSPLTPPDKPQPTYGPGQGPPQI